jgi:hypothetical protein
MGRTFIFNVFWDMTPCNVTDICQLLEKLAASIFRLEEPEDSNYNSFDALRPRI